MPTIEDGFLADVLAHPGADAPRLIYADWLDEQGREERAEFIRVQIELSRLPECSCVPLQHARCLRCVLVTRESLLLDDWRAVSVPWGSGVALDFPLGWTHRRGFLASVRLGTEQWLRDGPLFVSRCPLERVGLIDRHPYWPSDPPAGRFLWFRRADRWAEGNTSGADVPPQFWPHLPDCGTGASPHTTWGEALAALSDAALAWARSEALRTRHTPTVEIDSCPPPPAPVE